MKIINRLLVLWQTFVNYLSRLILGHSMYKNIRVTPKVYLGGAFTQRKIKLLKKWGITAVVSMRMVTPPVGIKTLHLPTRDYHAPTDEDLITGVEFIEKEVKNGGKVYVHCRAGVGRGPTMVIAYLISTGYTLSEAIELIKKVRNFINPTEEQMESLRMFAEKTNKA
ncbi:protein phosphatase [Candidatus Peregrinibacteria bacterium]|nr:protein phosphatase [Candidatus Peregrinibacteria bacterium]